MESMDIVVHESLTAIPRTAMFSPVDCRKRRVELIGHIAENMTCTEVALIAEAPVLRRSSRLTIFSSDARKPNRAVYSTTLRFIPPTSQENFEIPEKWERLCQLAVVGPPRYRSIERNLYRPPLQRGSCSADYIPKCSCSREDGCVADCQSRLLFMECVLDDCPSTGGNFSENTPGNVNQTPRKLSYCLNTCIQRKCYPKCEVFRAGDCGHGLRVCNDVPTRTILIEYTGEVITTRECNDRMRGMREKDDFYFASLGGGLMVDAKRMGSVARFANHSCDPNSELQKWSVMGESRIVLVSKKFLKSGTEITYNYQYFEDGLDGGTEMKRQKCLCGTLHCSGTIGGKVSTSESLSDVWVRKAEALLTGSRRHFLSVYTELYNSSKMSGMPSNCELLVELDLIITAASKWNLERNELFSSSIEKNVLINVRTCSDLLDRLPLGVKLKEASLLSVQVKKVLRIEKTLRVLEGGVGVGGGVESKAANGNVDLEVDIEVEVERRDGDISTCMSMCIDSAEHLSVTHPGSPSVLTETSSAATPDESPPVMCEECCSEKTDNGVCSGTESPSVMSVSSKSETVSNYVKTERNRTHAMVDDGNDHAPYGTEVRLEVQDPCVSAVPVPSKNVESEECIKEEDSLDIKHVPSTAAQKMKILHWEEMVDLIKDVVSVLPIRCDNAELLIELYSGVNEWSVEHVGGILHHSRHTSSPSAVYSLSHPSSIPTSSSSSPSSSSSSSSFSSSHSHHAPTTESSLLASSVIQSVSSSSTTLTSTIATPSTSHSNTTADTLRTQILNQKNLNPLIPVLNRLALSYNLKPIPTDYFAAEDFLEFRVGLFMERIDALRGEGRSTEIAKSRNRFMGQHAECGEEDVILKCDKDVMCFCRMPGAMAETPIQSQCDSCDKWFHPNCTNAVLVSRTASQKVESFLCPICLHRKGEPCNFAFRPVSEWKVSIHAGAKKEKQKTLKVVDRKHSDAQKGIVKNDDVLSSAADVESGRTRLESTAVCGSTDRSNTIGSYEDSVIEYRGMHSSNLQTSAVTHNHDEGLASHLSEDMSSCGALDGTVAYSLHVPTAGHAMYDQVSETVCHLLIGTPSVHHEECFDGTSNATHTAQSAPPLSVLALPLSERPKKTKTRMTPRRTSPDPMLVSDVTSAMAEERALRVHKSPAALLLGLCSVYVTEWRERALHFLTKHLLYPAEDDFFAVFSRMMDHQTSCTTLNSVDGKNLDLKDSVTAAIPGVPQGERNLDLNDTNNRTLINAQCATPGVRAVDGKERECILLQECLNLYFEPRLLRVKPPETLDLRAFAFLISASTALSALHTSDGYTTLIQSNNKGGFESKDDILSGCNNRIKEMRSRKTRWMTLNMLKRIIDGGKYLLSRLRNNKGGEGGVQGGVSKRPSQLIGSGVKGRTHTHAEGSIQIPQQCVDENGKEWRPHVKAVAAHADDNMHSVRQTLCSAMQSILAVVCSRLNSCEAALRAASEWRSRSRLKDQGDSFGHDYLTLHCDGSDVVLSDHSAECDIQGLCGAEKPDIENGENNSNYRTGLLALNSRVEDAGRGTFIEGEYSYARLKNFLLLESKREAGTDGCVGDTSEGTNGTGLCLGHSAVKYCWCRGVDDGRPMVQCDRCLEWFHCSCVGRGLGRSPLGTAKTVKAKKKKSCTQAVDYALKAVPSDDSTTPHTVSGTKTAKSKLKSELLSEQTSACGIAENFLLEDDDSDFYCIACTEEKGEVYPYNWSVH